MADFMRKVKAFGRKLVESGSIVEDLKKRAGEKQRRIVLCEGEDQRVVEAAQRCVEEKVAKIVLLGKESEIRAANPDVDLEGVEIINPASSPKLQEYADLLYELRKAKGMTPEQALEQAKDSTFFGALMLKAGDADGLVSGACHSTANTLRPGLQIIKTAPGVSAVSSFNLMIAPAGGNKYLDDGLIFFADCGLNPTYTAEGLADCAIATAAHPIADVDSFLNPNVVKVVLNKNGRALDFTRAPAPWPRDAFKKGPAAVLPAGLPAYHHIGLYAYRAGFLKAFPTLERAPIEAFESLEQLRALWHGYAIRVIVLEENLPAGVDTFEDLERVRKIFCSQQSSR